MHEFALIDRLRERLRPQRVDTRLGIGDDAAILSPPPCTELVVTTDTLVAGRHFPVDTPAEAIGFKSLAVNLSDIAAMAATPAWLTVSLSAPALSAIWCDAFVDGLLAAARTAAGGDGPIDIVGGDTTGGDGLVISITAIGHVPIGQAVRRDGARPGDLIAITGTLGDAAAGLACYEQAELSVDERWLIERLTRPTPRRGASLRGRAHAALDISDGFLADLGHMLVASGVGASVNIDALPCSEALARAIRQTRQRRRLQATGGDDYELCLSVPPDQIEPLREAFDGALSVVGRIEREPGLRLVDGQGEPLSHDALGPHGWDHFR